MTTTSKRKAFSSSKNRRTRPYGIEAVFRDESGNWFSLTERKARQ
jgi:hypothetical protein